jgi:DNA polymerase lambda
LKQKIDRSYFGAHFSFGKEFLQRIPREEVTFMQDCVVQIAGELDKNIVVETCGSYRRGALDCGDIDILLTHRKGEDISGLLEEMITQLHRKNFLTDDLSRGSSDKYMGVCCISPPNGSGIHRRIDIQCIPLDQWPLALLYFTGSAHFNRSMRLWARKNGFALSEKAIAKRFVIAKGPANQRVSENDLKGDPLPVKCEKDVFDILGLTYVPPTERNV